MNEEEEEEEGEEWLIQRLAFFSRFRDVSVLYGSLALGQLLQMLPLGLLVPLRTPSFPVSIRLGILTPYVGGRGALGAALVIGGWLLRRRAQAELLRNGTPTLLPDYPKTLVTTGPYAYLRHPMLAGATLHGIGVWLLLGGRFRSMLPFALVWGSYVYSLGKTEEELMEAFFPREYAAYCARVGWLRATSTAAEPEERQTG